MIALFLGMCNVVAITHYRITHGLINYSDGDKLPQFTLCICSHEHKSTDTRVMNVLHVYRFCFPSQWHAMHASSHCTLSSFVAYVAYMLPTVEGTKNLMIFLQMALHKYVMSILSIFRCWRGPGW